MSGLDERNTHTEELHNVINVVFQNIHDLSPSLRELVLSAKQYHKTLQVASQAAQNFYQTFSRLAQKAAGARGVTRVLGDEIHDIISVQAEIEKKHVQTIKCLNDEFIVPLESWIDTETVTIKSCQKNYQQDSKQRSELVDKARNELLKTQKKSQRSKSAEKYDQKEKQLIKNIEEYEKQLEDFRVQSCRKMLTEERKRYCFVIERLCNVMRSNVVANTQAVNSLNMRLPSWLSLINRNPEFPTDSSSLLKHLKSGGILQRRSSEPENRTSGTSTGNMQSVLTAEERSNPGAALTSKDAALKPPDQNMVGNRIRFRALFSHTGKDGSQLSFKEGDLLAALSDPVSGWQYGENLVSGSSGWFPVAYTEQVIGVPIGSTGSSTVPYGRTMTHSRIPLDMVDSSRGMPFFPLPDYSATPETSITDNNNSVPAQAVQAPPAPPVQTPEIASAPQNGSNNSVNSDEKLPAPPPGFGNQPEVPRSDTPGASSEDTTDIGKDGSEQKSNPFTGVKLKKTISNDRSAPSIS